MNDLNLIWTEAKEQADYAPEGIHPHAEFTGVEVMPAKEWNGKAMGDGIRFGWKLPDGKIASNIGTLKPSPMNTSGRLIKGLLGHEPKPGEAIDLKSCVGRKYTVVVTKNQNGRPVATTVQPE